MMYGKSTTPITGLSPSCSFAKTSENRHDSREVTFVGAVIEVLQPSQAVSPLKVSAGVIQTLALNQQSCRRPEQVAHHNFGTLSAFDYFKNDGAGLSHKWFTLERFLSILPSNCLTRMC